MGAYEVSVAAKLDSDDLLATHAGLAKLSKMGSFVRYQVKIELLIESYAFQNNRRTQQLKDKFSCFVSD